MKLGELFIQLGIKGDLSKVREFTEGIGGTVLKATALVAALAGVSLALKDVVQDAMGTSMALAMFEAQTGQSGQELQRWQMQAERAGVSADSVASSVMAIQSAMTEIRMGRGNLMPFQLLGVDVNQSPFAALDQIRERIKGMDRPLANNLISQLGINPEMIRLLSMTNTQLRAMNGDDLIISEKNRRKFVELRTDLVKLRQGLTYLATTIVSDIMPSAQEFTRVLHDWRGALTVIGVIAAGLAIAFAPVTAAVVGLLLILQDLDTWSKGGDSLIGGILDPIKNLAEAFKPLGAALAPLGTTTGITTGGGMFKNPVTGMANAISRQFTQQNNVNIAVHGTADAQDTADATKKAFDRSTDRAAAQADNEGY